MGRVFRAKKNQEEFENYYRGGAGAERSDGPSSFLRPSRTRQNNARISCRERNGSGGENYLGPCARKTRRYGRHSHKHGAGRNTFYRRGAPHQSFDRRSALSRDGKPEASSDGGQRTGRAEFDFGFAAVYPDCRNNAGESFVPAATLEIRRDIAA